MRSVVDLPQPEGPSRTTSLPESVAKLAPSTALAVPQCLLTRSRRSCIRLVSTPCRGRCSRENPRAASGRERAAHEGFDSRRRRDYATPPSTREVSMKTELVYLLLTAILTGVLWIPVVIGYVKSRGPLTRRELQGRADVAAAAVGQPRQPRARQRGRELRAVRRGRAGRQRCRHLDADHRGLRRGLLLRAPRPRHRPHQRHRPAQGAHDPVHDRLDRLPHLRHRRAGQDDVTIRRAVWRREHTLLHWKNSSDRAIQGAEHERSQASSRVPGIPHRGRADPRRGAGPAERNDPAADASGSACSSRCA